MVCLWLDVHLNRIHVQACVIWREKVLSFSLTALQYYIFFLSHHENGKQTFVKEFDTLFPCHVLILTSESCMQYAPQGLSLRTAVFFDHALLGLWEKNKQTNKKTPDVCLQLPVHNFCPWNTSFKLLLWPLHLTSAYMQVCPLQWQLLHAHCVCLMVLRVFLLLRKWKHGGMCCVHCGGRKERLHGRFLVGYTIKNLLKSVLFPRHPCPVKSRLTEVVLRCLSMASLTLKLAILCLTWPRPFFPTLLVHRSAG